MASALWNGTIPRGPTFLPATLSHVRFIPRCVKGAEQSTVVHSWTFHTKPTEYIKRKLPSMYHQFLELADVDITKGPIEVGPTCDYMIGGYSGR